MVEERILMLLSQWLLPLQEEELVWVLLRLPAQVVVEWLLERLPLLVPVRMQH
jgi:hypothetical protein